jgi:hypothetical protein
MNQNGRLLGPDIFSAVIAGSSPAMTMWVRGGSAQRTIADSWQHSLHLATANSVPSASSAAPREKSFLRRGTIIERDNPAS